MIRKKREDAGLTQVDLARLLSQNQPWVAHLESGERRVDVIEYVELAHVLKFDPIAELEVLLPLMRLK